MRIQQWLAASMLASMLLNANANGTCGDATDECAAKVCEIDAAIDAARKEGSMRKVATLKDLRAEALRCANRNKTQTSG